MRYQNNAWTIENQENLTYYLKNYIFYNTIITIIYNYSEYKRFMSASRAADYPLFIFFFDITVFYYFFLNPW